MYKLWIITASDKGANGERTDVSGATIERVAKEFGLDVLGKMVIPDDFELIKTTLIDAADDADLVLTTGGTGFSPRDITPEATKAVIDRECNGVTAAIVANGLRYTPRAMLSRAVCGIRKNTLILNLPGSPKAVEETLAFVMPSLLHGLDILNGGGECAR